MDPMTVMTKEGFVAACLVAVGLFVAWMVRTLMGVGIKTVEKVGTHIEANTTQLLRMDGKLDAHGKTLDSHSEHLQEIRARLGAKP
jgi:hypothetical protein